MSMEIYVLSDRQLASIAEWQAAINRDESAVRLSAARAFAELRGALPVELQGRATAFEVDHVSASEVMSDYDDIDFDRPWTFALAFRWGADFDAAIAVYLAAAAYARAADGVILDCEDGKVIAPPRAREIAREIERSVPEIEAAVKQAMEKFQKKPPQ